MFRTFLTILSLFVAINLTIPSYSESLPASRTAPLPKTLEFDTIHGHLVVGDPLAIELILSPAMQRLKGILQYGVNEFIIPSSYPYTRFDHSLGVYQLLKMHNRSRKEQIAGLLHDVSHTVFSHLSDMLFLKGFDKGNYQDLIHQQFLKEYNIQDILQKYGLTVEDVLPDKEEFLALEQHTPNLCADRIEYNIHAGDLTGMLSSKDIKMIHSSLHFNGKDWYFDNVHAGEKLAHISLQQTIENWSSADNLMISKWICKALSILLKKKQITIKGIHFSYSDAELWQILESSKDPKIKTLVDEAKTIHKCYTLREQNTPKHVFKFKSRAIDPYIKIDGKLYRLTELSPRYKRQFEALKKKAATGWNVEALTACQPVL